MASNDDKSRGPLMLRLVFAIFMVLVYVAFGVLLFTPFFDVTFNGLPSGLYWLRYFIGVILIIYGFYRGWRLYKGLHPNDYNE